MSRARSPLLALALAVVLFGAGAGAGVAIDRLWLRPDVSPVPTGATDATDGRRARGHRRGPPSPEHLLERFRGRLSLSDAQAGIILDILRDIDTEMRAGRERARETRRAMRKRGQARILEVLDQDQAIEYRKLVEREESRMRKHWRERWQMRDSRKPPGPPPDQPRE